MHALIKKIANFFGVLDKNTVKKGILCTIIGNNISSFTIAFILTYKN
jgi:hypothetical protein